MPLDSNEDLSRLILRLEPRLRKLLDESLSSSLGELLDPDDLLEEVYLRVFAEKRLVVFAGSDDEIYHSVAAFLAHVLRNEVRSLFRKKRDPSRTESLESAAFDPKEIPAQGTHDPAEILSRSEMRARVIEVVVTLPAPEDDIVRLALCGLSTREIARELALPVERVRRKQSQARARLRTRLRFVWEDYDS